MEDNISIEFNPKILKEFIDAYNKCDKETFIFYKNKILKSYAKYLIRYLIDSGMEPE